MTKQLKKKPREGARLKRRPIRDKRGEGFISRSAECGEQCNKDGSFSKVLGVLLPACLDCRFIGLMQDTSSIQMVTNIWLWKS